MNKLAQMGARQKWAPILLLSLFVPTLSWSQNVVGWGTNHLANVPPSATNVIDVAAGAYHVLALRADGTVLAWGSLSYVPSDVTNIIAISAGQQYSLALRDDGTVLAWGVNDRGQLNVPPDATNVVGISAGQYSSLALRSDGTLTGWTNFHGYYPNGTPANVIDISGLHYYFVYSDFSDQQLVLFADGRGTSVSSGWVYRAGFRAPLAQAISGGAYQSLSLCVGGKVSTPKRLTRWTTPAPADLTNAVLVSAGVLDHMAVTARGEVKVWGKTTLTNVPASATNIIAISSGPDYCVAVIADHAKPKILGRSPVVYQQRVPVASPLPLYVRAIGSQPMHYEWQADGVPIANSDTPFPQIAAQLGTDDVEYSVRVYNDYGSVTSAAGRVNVGRMYGWGDNKRGQQDYPFDLTNAVTVAAGAFHALALRDDGTVCAWGKNADGQANVPANLTDVAAIAAGGDHSLALKNDGSLMGWGRNWDGQCAPPADVVGIRAISAGWAHSLALRSDGRVVAWGNNDYGQTNVSLLPKDLIGVAAGYFHSAALRANGTVVTWGWEVPVPAAASNVVAIAAGWEHCLALRGDGTIVAWGNNSYGQCNIPLEATNIVQISAGYYHSIARRSDGSVLAWGRNAFGTTAVPISLRNASWVAAGEDYSLALIGGGLPTIVRSPFDATAHVGETRVLSAELAGAAPITFQWFHANAPVPGATNAFLVLSGIRVQDAGVYTLIASNPLGSALGNATVSVLEALDSEMLTSTLSVTFGGNFCLQGSVAGSAPVNYRWQLNGADLTDGTGVTGAGSLTLCVTNAGFSQSGTYALVAQNAFGAITTLVAHISVSTIIGWGDNSAGQLNMPGGEADVQQIAAGGMHSLLLRGDGTVIAWGDNTFGQTNVPSTATNIVAVAAGAQHSVALRQDGTVLAWGDNSRRQTEVPVFRATPVAVACGDLHSLALLSDGTIAAWGNNWAPTNVAPLGTNVIAIAAGGTASLGLTADHVLANLYFGSSYNPVVNVLSNVVAMARGSRHTLALRSDGSLVGLGNNDFGQRTIPNQATNVIAISAAGDNNLVLLNDRSVLAWGADESGQADPPDLRSFGIRAISQGSAHGLALMAAGVESRPPVIEIFAAPGSPSPLAMIRLRKLSGTGLSVIYASEEMVGWSAMVTNLPTLGPVQYVEPADVTRFYRAAERR